ncbi:GNAT family N-acetyltransferase [Chromatiales bacterium (ex Bugula neritina AB1)]|nr:GNAT family N-acetyltransferase [Chromatiales bacterium (ex Bugula neritina AB1)]
MTTESQQQNALGQPIGFSLDQWKAPPFPPATAMHGRFCRVVPLDVEAHAGDLFDAFIKDAQHGNWTYLPYGPFAALEEFRQWLETVSTNSDPMFHSVVDQQTGKAVGVTSYLRIQPDIGSIEVGHIHFSPLLQKRPMATEAMYLMMRRVFDELGYRRYEWKCDSLNQPSRNAAQRLGFSYEGLFRQAALYKSRNRDTAWYSIIDSEWPALKKAFERWLAPENFDSRGSQQASLVSFRE